jgi:anti-anti-sigma factor
MEPAEPQPGQSRHGELVRIRRSERDGVFAITAVGELDMSNVEALRESTLQIPNHALGVVIDLGAVTFMDSATVGLLFELRQSLARRSQGLAILAPGGSPADRVLEITGFEPSQRLDVELPEAIALLRERFAERGDGAAPSASAEEAAGAPPEDEEQGGGRPPGRRRAGRARPRSDEPV